MGYLALSIYGQTLSLAVVYFPSISCATFCRVALYAGSVFNKSGDDVYKQQMMDNFRFSSASIA